MLPPSPHRDGPEALWALLLRARLAGLSPVAHSDAQLRNSTWLSFVLVLRPLMPVPRTSFQLNPSTQSFVSGSALGEPSLRQDSTHLTHEKQDWLRHAKVGSWGSSYSPQCHSSA